MAQKDVINILKVDLVQISSGWIRLHLQTNKLCLKISTSIVFNPYRDLYAWLGKIRDGQLPATLIIDEEGHGVEISAEEITEQITCIRIIPWFGSDQKILMEFQAPKGEIVHGFSTGILDFIARDNHWRNQAFFRSIINLNWCSLTQESESEPINWQHWLILQGVPEKGNGGRDLSQLSCEQQWAATLRQAIDGMSLLIKQGHKEEAMELAALFRNLPIDLVSGPIQAQWYAERLTQLFQTYAFYRNIVSIPGFDIPQPLCEQEREERESIRQQRCRIYEQYKSFQVGQLVEGSITAFRVQGVFVKIGELHVFLPLAEISHLQPAYADQVFQAGDRIKALVIFAHAYRVRIAISTRELEKEPGDMLRDPEMVYATAEEMAERYRELVISRMSHSSRDASNQS